jgi:hypothetical protein
MTKNTIKIRTYSPKRNSLPLKAVIHPEDWVDRDPVLDDLLNRKGTYGYEKLRPSKSDEQLRREHKVFREKLRGEFEKDSIFTQIDAGTDKELTFRAGMRMELDSDPTWLMRSAREIGIPLVSHAAEVTPIHQRRVIQISDFPEDRTA